MNDDFLHRLRKEPPPDFAARLRARLKFQTPARRFSLVHILVIGFVVGGSALAATFWAVKGRPVGDAEPVLAREEAVSTPSPAAIRSRDASTSHQSAASNASEHTRFASEHSASTSPSEKQPMQAEEIESNSQSGVVGGPLLISSEQHAGGANARLPRRLFSVAGPFLTYAMTQMVVERSGAALAIDVMEDESAFAELCHARSTFAIATRRMTKDDLQLCPENAVKSIAEAKIGHVGIVLTAAKTSSLLKVSAKDIYLALAKQVPGDEPNRVIDNPNFTWRQVNPYLELVNIAVLGPAPESALGKTAASLILEAGCDSYPWIKSLRNSDPERHRRICHTIREDGVYVAVEENNVLVSQRLLAEPNTMALLSFGFYAQQRDLVIGSQLNGAEPTIASIASGDYAYARPIYVYARAERMHISSMWRFRDTYLSTQAIGPNGYLTYAGFIALDRSQLPVQTQMLEIRKAP